MQLTTLGWHEATCLVSQAASAFLAQMTVAFPLAWAALMAFATDGCAVAQRAERSDRCAVAQGAERVSVGASSVVRAQRLC